MLPGSGSARARDLPLSLARAVGLALTAALHAPLACLAGVALRHLPHLDGLPVLLGATTPPSTREHLQSALHLLTRISPSRRARLLRRVLGLFMTSRPHTHDHYSRITGTCTFDLDRLTCEAAVTTAGFLVRGATEAWPWRRGHGPSLVGEHRLLLIADVARARFEQRAALLGLPRLDWRMKLTRFGHRVSSG